MRRLSVLTIVLAACLVSSVAFAANDKVTATFESLSASGVTGQADLNPGMQGEGLIHTTLRGLVAGAQYVAVIYQQNQTCGSGSPITEFARFVANPAGNATFNGKVALELSQIGSIGIQRVSDSALQACASVSL